MDTKGYRHEQAANIGALIRQLRKASGMTQVELSEKVGISYQQVQKYEYGTSELTIGKLRQFADALRVPAEVFLGEGNMASGSKTSFDYDESKLLIAFRNLKSDELKHIAIKMLRAMAENS